MSNVHYLVPDRLPNDSAIRCLAQLYKQARMGNITGIAFVAYLQGLPYIANSAGAAFDNPVLTRGMLLDLDAKLALRVNGGNL